MQIQQLEAFVEVVRLGSVVKAAQRMHLSQPALTLRIKALERAIGAPVLARSAYGMRLTEAGRSLQPFAERILSLAEDAGNSVRDIARGGSGTLFLGAQPSAVSCIPEIVQRFREMHPDVFIQIVTGSQTEVREMILREHVQLGFARIIRDPAIEATPLYRDDVVLVSSPHTGLGRRKRIAAKELAGLPLMRVRRAVTTRDVVSDLFDEVGISPVERTSVDTIEFAKRMAELGIGMMIMPLSLVWEEADRKAIQVTRLSGAGSDSLRDHMLMAAMRRKNAAASPLVDSFIEAAKTFVPPGAHPLGPRRASSTRSGRRRAAPAAHGAA